ncbi:MAG: diguanylate cyclase [Myxococcota bacterium]
MTRILIIDDSSTIRDAMVETLRSHGVAEQFATASNGLAGLKELLNGEVDLVVCDLEMPDLDGYKFLSLKKEQLSVVDIPVVMLTGVANDVSSKVRCFEAGASDYVTKPYEPLELIARVRAHLSLKLLRDELRDKAKILEELSATDELTGLTNRRRFFEHLRVELSRAERHKTPTGLLMMDIDHFKSINDIHGHQGGDLALAAVGKLLKHRVRAYDIAARYGGEEFCVLLPDTPLKDAQEVAERLREGIEAIEVRHDGEPVSLTVSIGIAHAHGIAVEGPLLIKHADAALYAAKSAGRNRVMTG